MLSASSWDRCSPGRSKIVSNDSRRRKEVYNLAHILASVFHLHTLDVKCPRIVVVVRHRQSSVIGNDVLVDGQNGFCIGLYPGNLFTTRNEALFTMNANKYSTKSMVAGSSYDEPVRKVIYVIETFLKWKHQEPALKIFKSYWPNIEISESVWSEIFCTCGLCRDGE